MTRILAIDPGSTQSAFVLYDVGAELPLAHGREPNAWLRDRLRMPLSALTEDVDEVVIEWMQPRGMPTSAQEFETLFWIGRFAEAGAATGLQIRRLPRLRVKVALCGKANAKDVNIRQALIDRFGGSGGKAAAVGLKASPGPLYGVKADVWAALAVAVAWSEGAKPYIADGDAGEL